MSADRSFFDLWRRPRGWRAMAAAAAIAVLVTAGMGAVYLTGGTETALPHVLYVPVILAAFLFGITGGVLAGLTAGLALGPLMPLDVAARLAQPAQGWLFRLVFFLVVGVLVGGLHDLARSRLEEVERLLEKVSFVYSQVLSTFAAIAEHRDKPTGEHHLRMAHNARLMGEVLGLRELDREVLYWAALLHDLGKVAVPDDVLTKPGPLTPAEQVEVRRHVEIGAELLLGVSADFTPVVEGVRAHHERWDGSGYPAGLRGEAIPLSGRVLAVVDVFDALTCIRPYRDAISPEEAMQYLSDRAGSAFDPRLVEAFEGLYRRGAVLVEGDPHLAAPELTPTHFHSGAISY